MGDFIYNLSIKSLNIKDRGNENPRREKSVMNQTKKSTNQKGMNTYLNHL